jgi:hypothetical protein
MNIGTIDIRCVNEVAIFGGAVVPLGLRPLPPAWARPAPHPSTRYVDPDCLYGTRSSRSGRITTLSCSFGSLRAPTNTAGFSLRLTATCGTPGGTYK